MGKGTDIARADSPEHAQLIDDLKEQLLIVFLKRLGGEISVPVKEIDDTGGYLFSFNIIDRVFNFSIERKH